VSGEPAQRPAGAAVTREPAQRLPGAALRLWRIQAGGIALAATIGAAIVLGPVWAVPVLVVGAALAVGLPAVRFARWRYEVRAEEIDLRHGLFTIHRTLVPIRRVQHVDTSSGPMQSAFDLATVSFHTAAGETEIPALTRAEAEAVRRRIGELARSRDDT
jgi:membrane protein YdbS with pleckstrin-like domain